MMSWIFCGMILIAVIFSALNGKISDVSAAAMSEAAGAVELVISLMGSVCLWSGLMRVADRSGFTQKLSRLFSPVTSLLFRGLDRDSPAAKAITMNLTANLLGLGNAATPLGITAMREMEKLDPQNRTASDNMITFVVLNTASLQLIPTTTAMLRLRAGSAAPMEILPAVWAASAASVASGIAAAKLYGKLGKGRLPERRPSLVQHR